MNRERLNEIKARATQTPTLSDHCRLSDIQLVANLLYDIRDLLAYVDDLEKASVEAIEATAHLLLILDEHKGK